MYPGRGKPACGFDLRGLRDKSGFARVSDPNPIWTVNTDAICELWRREECDSNDSDTRNEYLLKSALLGGYFIILFNFLY